MDSGLIAVETKLNRSRIVVVTTALCIVHTGRFVADKIGPSCRWRGKSVGRDSDVGRCVRKLQLGPTTIFRSDVSPTTNFCWIDLSVRFCRQQIVHCERRITNVRIQGTDLRCSEQWAKQGSYRSPKQNFMTSTFPAMDGMEAKFHRLYCDIFNYFLQQKLHKLQDHEIKRYFNSTSIIIPQPPRRGH